MGKRVRYPNGFEGFASDVVAAILEKKGAAKIISEAKPAESKKGRGKSKDEDEE